MSTAQLSFRSYGDNWGSQGWEGGMTAKSLWDLCQIRESDSLIISSMVNNIARPIVIVWLLLGHLESVTFNQLLKGFAYAFE